MRIMRCRLALSHKRPACPARPTALVGEKTRGWAVSLILTLGIEGRNIREAAALS